MKKFFQIASALPTATFSASQGVFVFVHSTQDRDALAAAMPCWIDRIYDGCWQMGPQEVR